jgi:hypothetical protein
MSKKLIGYYNETGYHVDMYDDSGCAGESLCETGNNPCDSSPENSLPLDGSLGEPLNLTTIKELCHIACEIIVANYPDYKFVGIQYEEM